MLATLLGLLRVDAPTRVVGTLSLVAALSVYAMALEAVRRASADADEEKGAWYVGYTRDVTNSLGLVLLWLSHFVLGFPLHLALVAGSVTALFAYLADYLFARVLGLRHRTAALVLVTVVATLPTQVAPDRICDAYERLLVALF